MLTNVVWGKQLQYVQELLRTMGTGLLPSGARTTRGPIPPQDIRNTWNNALLPTTLPRAGRSALLRTPNDYFFDRFGSQGNRAPMVLADRIMNQFKGRIFDGVDPQSRREFDDNLRDVVGGGDRVAQLLQPLKMVSPVLVHDSRGSKILMTNITT